MYKTVATRVWFCVFLQRAAVEESNAALWRLQMSDISSGHKTDILKLQQLLFGLHFYEQR